MMNEKKKNKVTVTKGMSKAVKNVARRCPNCDLAFAKYPGRYPNKCPDCGVSLRTPTAQEQIEMLRAGVFADDIVYMVEQGFTIYIAEKGFIGKAARAAGLGKAADAVGRAGEHLKKSKERLKQAAKGVKKKKKKKSKKKDGKK